MGNILEIVLIRIKCIVHYREDGSAIWLFKQIPGLNFVSGGTCQEILAHARFALVVNLIAQLMITQVFLICQIPGPLAYIFSYPATAGWSSMT